MEADIGQTKGYVVSQVWWTAPNDRLLSKVRAMERIRAMQIEITFNCCECGQENTLGTDTSDYGFLKASAHGLLHTVEIALPLDLSCRCGHVSGELGLGYRFLQKHRPSHEKSPEDANKKQTAVRG